MSSQSATRVAARLYWGWGGVGGARARLDHTQEKEIKIESFVREI